LRDIGGYGTISGGTVRAGLLYRSTALDRLAWDDIETLGSLGLRSVFDFRSEAERSAEPDRLPSGVRRVALDVLKDSSDAAPAQLFSILSDPKAATELLGGGKAIQLFDQGYRELVTLPSALDAYGKFFTAIARSGARPALFHCTTGKDRTGWAAAATLLLLGVSARGRCRK
jgi:protein-tyrosine phosphatase